MKPTTKQSTKSSKQSTHTEAAPESGTHLTSSLTEAAIRAIGHGGRDDDDPTLSVIDALSGDMEILRIALQVWDGEDCDLVKCAEHAVQRFQERLLVVRALHKAAGDVSGETAVAS